MTELLQCPSGLCITRLSVPAWSIAIASGSLLGLGIHLPMLETIFKVCFKMLIFHLIPNIMYVMSFFPPPLCVLDFHM